jgi:hypothetical protein
VPQNKGTDMREVPIKMGIFYVHYLQENDVIKQKERVDFIYKHKEENRKESDY